MFDLTPTPAQSVAVAEVRVLRNDIRDRARELNDAGRVPEQLWRAVAKAAQATPAAINERSSVLLDPVGLVLVAEELAVADAGLALAILGSALTDLIVTTADGSPLPGPAALALYEGFGRNPSEFKAEAHNESGVVRLTARKQTVVRAVEAERFLVVARDVGGLGLFRVDAADPDVTIERDDVEVGTLALGAARTAEVSFHDVAALRVPGGDAETVARAVAAARLLIPAIAVGCGQAAVDGAAQWVSGRSVRGAPLAANQGVTFPLVDADIALSRARLRLWDTASRIAAQDDSAALERLVSRAAAVGCSAGSSASRVACNVMGWRGLSQRFPAEMSYRDTSLLAAIDFDPLLNGLPVLEAV